MGFKHTTLRTHLRAKAPHPGVCMCGEIGSDDSRFRFHPSDPSTLTPFLLSTYLTLGYVLSLSLSLLFRSRVLLNESNNRSFSTQACVQKEVSSRLSILGKKQAHLAMQTFIDLPLFKAGRQDR